MAFENMHHLWGGFTLLLLALAMSGVNSQCHADANSFDFVGLPPLYLLYATKFNFAVKIVVGGGTAGLAISTRLSQGLPNDCVLVVEAGPYEPNEQGINVPGKKGSTLGGPYDWNFTTIPQPDLNNRRISSNRGRVLGGSSALNLMSWDRASVADYDSWEALGNPGWNWKRFIAAMLKAETFQRTNDQYGSEGLGTDGPIHTLINRLQPSQQQGFYPAMESLGVRLNLNSLDGDPLGSMYHMSNIRESNYTRSYSTGYLWRAGPNLNVLENTTVSRIVFSNTSNSGKLLATGVNIGGRIIQARKEVILSAGAFQSPALLELSGIGDTAVLTDAGITTLFDLPGVGSNLQDHIRIQNSYQLKPNYTTSLDELRTNATYATEQISLWDERKVSTYDYTATGYAYLTWDQALGNSSSDLVDLAKQSADPNNVIDQHKLSYLTTNLSTQVPSLEIILSDGYTGVKGPPVAASPNYDAHFFTLIAVVMHPLSRGTVHINSSDPTGKPVINPNYVSNLYDLRAITEAAKYSRKIALSPGMVETWTDEYEPGLDAVQTEAAWEQFARNTTLSIYHPLGTCAMLSMENRGVVSPELIVHGTTNLRVVDASVIPIQPSAHIQSMIYGIAEIAAEMVVEQYM